MTVTGGASPGLYERSSDTLEDRNVYTQTEDGEVVAHFRFLEGSIRRRLEENFEGEDTRGLVMYLVRSRSSHQVHRHMGDLSPASEIFEDQGRRGHGIRIYM